MVPYVYWRGWYAATIWLQNSTHLQHAHAISGGEYSLGVQNALTDCACACVTAINKSLVVSTTGMTVSTVFHLKHPWHCHTDHNTLAVVHVVYVCYLQVEEILSGAHSQGVDAGVVAEEGVLAAYRAATGQAAAGGAAAAGSSVNNRKPVDGDCPICFSPLEVRAGWEYCLCRGRRWCLYLGRGQLRACCVVWCAVPSRM
jgi:hypothetical protein